MNLISKDVYRSASTGEVFFDFQNAAVSRDLSPECLNLSPPGLTPPESDQ